MTENYFIKQSNNQYTHVVFHILFIVYNTFVAKLFIYYINVGSHKKRVFKERFIISIK